MASKPPVVIYVIGLLHLLLAFVGALAATYRTAVFVAGPALATRFLTPEQQQDRLRLETMLHKQAPAFAVYQVVANVALPWLLTGLLLGAGLGLLRLRPRGWSLSVLYAALSIGSRLAIAAYTMLFLLPSYRTPLLLLNAEASPARFGMTNVDIAATAESASVLVAVIAPMVLMIYPFFVLFAMLRSDVRTALTPSVPLSAGAANAS